jgi:lipoyl synthase
LRRRIPLLNECGPVESVVRKNDLHTVCREALCPNRAECYSKSKATFMILGDVCTRGCLFCSVRKGIPSPPDPDEPRRLARAAAELALASVIVTSVTRDDLPDGGASHFARVIRELKRLHEPPIVEALVPDFGGSSAALETVLAEGADVLSHNLETVRRLYGTLRRRADYDRSLFLLSEAKRIGKEVMTKSALILGMGETTAEVVEALRDLGRAGCDFLAIGQYLRPGMDQIPANEFIPPERFSWFEEQARRMGFLQVIAGPLVRSSSQDTRLTLDMRGRPAESGRRCEEA